MDGICVDVDIRVSRDRVADQTGGLEVLWASVMGTILTKKNIFEFCVAATYS